MFYGVHFKSPNIFETFTSTNLASMMHTYIYYYTYREAIIRCIESVTCLNVCACIFQDLFLVVCG